MRLRFVTSNEGKVREAATVLRPHGIDVEGVDVPTHEPQADTLEIVAAAKAESVRAKVATPYFVEDAGLFVDSIRGFPGVVSAYAFKTIGWQGLLAILDHEIQRLATFRAVVAYVDGPGPPHLVTGECRGRIARTAAGSGGFGFDPIFIPEGETRTFAELTPKEKSNLSHRGRALEALALQLKSEKTTEGEKKGKRARKQPTS